MRVKLFPTCFLKSFDERRTLLLIYQVFDGHGGKHAADFARCNLLQYIIKNKDFPQEIEKVVSSAFLQTDAAFAEACSFDAALASGTTALAAIIMGRLEFFWKMNFLKIAKRRTSLI